MRTRFYFNREWLSGVSAAFLGVVLARGAGAIASPGTKTQAGLALAGELIAIGGLGVIVFGIHRRSRRPRPDSAQ
jgi:hypothetical protein